MKRHFISDDDVEQEGRKDFNGSGLTILGNNRDLVCQGRDTPGSEHQDVKKRKLEDQTKMEERITNKIEDDDDDNRESRTDKDSNLKYLNLVSSAVAIISKDINDTTEKQQEDQASSSSSSSTSETTRSSRSDSLSSEDSIYRSYEMALPKMDPQFHRDSKDLQPMRPPSRLPTVSDLPPLPDTNSCTLNSRCYGKRDMIVNNNNYNAKDKTIQAIDTNKMPLQSVVYRWRLLFWFINSSIQLAGWNVKL